MLNYIQQDSSKYLNSKYMNYDKFQSILKYQNTKMIDNLKFDIDYEKFVDTYKKIESDPTTRTPFARTTQVLRHDLNLSKYDKYSKIDYVATNLSYMHQLLDLFIGTKYEELFIGQILAHCNAKLRNYKAIDMASKWK